MVDDGFGCRLCRRGDEYHGHWSPSMVNRRFRRLRRLIFMSASLPGMLLRVNRGNSHAPCYGLSTYVQSRILN